MSTAPATAIPASVSLWPMSMPPMPSWPPRACGSRWARARCRGAATWRCSSIPTATSSISTRCADAAMATAIRCLAATYYGGFHIRPHHHHWGQLIYAASGVMRVQANGMLWIVPPARAVWVPAEVEHEIHALGDFAMRSLYFPVELIAGLAGECCALEIETLLRELVLELVERCPIDDADTSSMRLAKVAIELVGAATAQPLPLRLPLPLDPRAARIADRLRDDPACVAELPELARAAGASARTIQR